MTHIIRLDGKLWAFDPPEKPYQNRKEGIPTISKSWADYDHAYSLALEQKIEVEKPELVFRKSWSGDWIMKDERPGMVEEWDLVKENEPIKWEGGVEYGWQIKVSTAIDSKYTSCTEEEAKSKPGFHSRRVVRLIAPVKEEKKDPCAYEEECQHPACNCPPTVTPFKPCPKCRTRDFASCHSMQCPMRKGEPVPSEQENQTLPSPDEIRHALQLIQNAIEDPREASGLKEAWNLISDNLTKIEEGLTRKNKQDHDRK